MITINPAFYVFGSNTNVGKTLFTTALSYAASKKSLSVHYIKPLQTGYPQDSDSAFIKKYVSEEFVKVTNFILGENPVSPHRLHSQEKTITDEELLVCLEKEVEKSDSHCVFIEGAGGIASPSLHGQLQCDVYKKCLLPCVFVGDSSLGGISGTISALEMAQSRGFKISCLMLFEGENENYLFLQSYFKSEFPVFAFPEPKKSFVTLENWLDKNLFKFQNVLDHLLSFHEKEKHLRQEAILLAKNHVWWPFTQHKLIPQADFIESACGDEVVYANGESSGSQNKGFQSYFDGSASWWTQGLGHGNVSLMKAARYAAGRYGHVLFPGHIHEPASKLIQVLLETVGRNWANRVFFSDNGSTAVEVALKMAFRKSFGKETTNEIPYVLGLKDSYHGDTHAAMDATNPNVFKGKDHWYKPRGVWLDYPSVTLKNGSYFISLPKSFDSQESVSFDSLEQIFSSERHISLFAQSYRMFIEKELNRAGYVFGACLLEGVVMGSGGMKWVDPLFQKILVEFCQEQGIPVILDEVFTGFWRLGKKSSAEYLGIKPDIACYGKLLTGGLMPMSVTLAKEEIFQEFFDDSLQNALLHGHSYTATPMGCEVAVAAINEIQKSSYFNKETNSLDDLWSNELIKKISYLSWVERVYALGTLFVLEIKDDKPGYCSARSKELVKYLKERNVEVRPLGNVIYIMAGFDTPKDHLNDMLKIFLDVPSDEKNNVLP
jgi:dethiobiotin synthetase/adenosylmethionine--8-amino-7-oxononanoate aminotransferase